MVRNNLSHLKDYKTTQEDNFTSYSLKLMFVSTINFLNFLFTSSFYSVSEYPNKLVSSRICCGKKNLKSKVLNYLP